MESIKLGDVARDSVTGFQGVAIAVCEWLHGCQRITIQPQKLGKDGKPIESQTFDTPQLTLVRRAAVAAGTRDTGGPRPEPMRRADPR